MHEARERDFVRAALLAYADHDGGLALVYRRAARVLEAVLDARHVAQAYHRAVAHRDGQVFELRGGGVLADDAYAVLLRPRLDAPRGQLDVLVVYSVLDFLRGYAVALERLGVEPDAHLALAEAGELHAADAAHRLEALLHDLVDVARERLHVRAPVVLDRDAHNRAVARVELVYFRLVAVVRQRAERAAHLVAHVRGREVYVAVELELHDDDGAPLVAARAHALDSFDCVDARFEHVRHVVVDDGGARALERRAHDDYRELDVRHPLDAHVHVRVSAEDYGGDRDDEDRYRPAQRNFRDFHEASSPCIVYIFSHT